MNRVGELARLKCKFCTTFIPHHGNITTSAAQIRFLKIRFSNEQHVGGLFVKEKPRNTYKVKK